MAFQKNIGGPSFQGMGNPARPAQTVASGMPDLLNAGLQAANIFDDRKTAADKAAAEAEQAQVVQQYTQESIGRALDAHPAVQRATAQIDQSRIPQGDMIALNQAAEQAERLSIMQQQTGDVDYINYQKLAQHRKYLAQYPHLAPELNKLFKDAQGTGIMGYADESFEREDAEATAQLERQRQQADAQRQARMTTINTALNASGIVPPANPQEAEMLAIESGAVEAWGQVQRGSQLLSDANNRNDLTSAERLRMERAAARDVLPNLHLETSTALRSLATGGVLEFNPDGSPTVVGGDPNASFNPETDRLDPEQLQQLDLYINSLRNYAATSFRESRDEVLPMIESQLKFAEMARNYYAGEVTRSTYESQHTLRQVLARQGLPEESYEIEALGEVYKNLPDGFLSAASKNRLMNEGFSRLTTNLALSLAERNRGQTPGDALDGVRVNLPESAQGVRELAVSITKGMNQPEFSSDPEVRDTYARTLEALTVRMGRDPSGLPPAMYEAIGEALANDKIIDVLNEYEGLTGRNAQVGYAEYARTMREALMEDLGMELGPRTTPVDQRREPGAALWQQDNISMRVDRGGNLVFSSTDRSDQASVARAERLQKRYGRKFARLNKIYSHVVEFNKDYAANANYLAAQMLNGDQALGRAFELGRATEEAEAARAEQEMNRTSALPSGQTSSRAAPRPTPAPAPASRGDITPAAGGVNLGDGDERAQTEALFDMIDEGTSVADIEAQFDALGIGPDNLQRQKIMRRVRAYAAQ